MPVFMVAAQLIFLRYGSYPCYKTRACIFQGLLGSGNLVVVLR